MKTDECFKNGKENLVPRPALRSSVPPPQNLSALKSHVEANTQVLFSLAMVTASLTCLTC